MTSVVLETKALCKDFGPVRVLHEIDFSLQKGEVHAVIGENGAGKSTLVKILSGYHSASDGQIILKGKRVTFQSTKQAEDQGIIMIHQEFNLAPDLTVEENIFLGKEITHGPLLNKRAMSEACARVLHTLKTDVDPKTSVKRLSVSTKQMVEIGKAIARKAQILIMDEPTAVLTSTEIDVLFSQIESLQNQGVSIIYISHKLDEVKRLANSVTILRDGHKVTSASSNALSEEDMARLMVGRTLEDMYPSKGGVSRSEEILRVSNIACPGIIKNANFSLMKGEILGFAGLVGAGRTELMETVLGLRPRSCGEIYYRGERVELKTYLDAVNRRIVYLSEDRKGKGLLVNMRLGFNLTLLALKRYCNKISLVDQGKEMQALQRAVQEYSVQVPSLHAKMATLSGGNQQKIALAKIMDIDPDIVVLDEPTRGIDVGTKQQIYFFMRELVTQGRSCILVSSELQEIIGLSDRVIVMANGTTVGTLSGPQITEEEIMRYATGLKGGCSVETSTNR